MSRKKTKNVRGDGDTEGEREKETGRDREKVGRTRYSKKFIFL